MDYFETGFAVREQAWHGLAKVLENAPRDTVQAVRDAGVDWPVRTVPAYALVGDRYLEVPDARHVVRERNGFEPDVLGTVGTRYVPLQNADAFRWFNPLLADGDMSLESAGSVKGGRYVWILAKVNSIPRARVGSKADDIVEPYFLLSNAHDGTNAVTGTFTFVRVVCWNTLSAALRESDRKRSASFKIRHTRAMADTLRDFRNRIDLERRNFEGKALLWQELSERRIERATDAETYVRRVFGTPETVAKAMAEHEPLPEVRAEKHVARLFREGPGADSAGPTWFGLYMAATHYIDHERGRSADSRLASTWFGDGVNVRDRAESVALELAGV